LRVMWFPYVDYVVVVMVNKVENKENDERKFIPEPINVNIIDSLEHFISLLEKKDPNYEHYPSSSFTDLRRELISLQPFNTPHIKLINKSEVEYYINIQHQTRTLPSYLILQIDCGGSHQVQEVCFPTGKLRNNTGKDIEFIDYLLVHIEMNLIPAPEPIEQRWTYGSQSNLSPANRLEQKLEKTYFSWLCIIMYLPLESERKK